MDGIEAVTDTVNKIHPISVNSLSALISIIHYESIPEGQTFINKGARNEFEYIITVAAMSTVRKSTIFFFPGFLSFNWLLLLFFSLFMKK